jgi:hypothetical protein
MQECNRNICPLQASLQETEKEKAQFITSRNEAEEMMRVQVQTADIIFQCMLHFLYTGRSLGTRNTISPTERQGSINVTCSSFSVTDSAHFMSSNYLQVCRARKTCCFGTMQVSETRNRATITGTGQTTIRIIIQCPALKQEHSISSGLCY